MRKNRGIPMPKHIRNKSYIKQNLNIASKPLTAKAESQDNHTFIDPINMMIIDVENMEFKFEENEPNPHKYGFVYTWVHIPTGRYYIGSRTAKFCHPNDGYICSSKVVKPMILGNPSEWKRRVLFIHPMPRLVVMMEAEFLKGLDAKDSERCFNMHNGDGKFSMAGRVLPVRTEEHKKRLSESQKGKIISDLAKKKTRETNEARKKQCPHCGTVAIPRHYSRYHGEKCLSNPGMNEEDKHALTLLRKKPCSMKRAMDYQCEHCGKQTTKQAYERFHGPICKDNASLSDAQRLAIKNERAAWMREAQTACRKTLICIHCGTEAASGSFAKYHGDNCLQNSMLSDEEKTHLKRLRQRDGAAFIIKDKKCVHCEIVTTAASYAQWHGDRCKMRPNQSDSE